MAISKGVDFTPDQVPRSLAVPLAASACAATHGFSGRRAFTLVRKHGEPSLDSMLVGNVLSKGLRISSQDGLLINEKIIIEFDELSVRLRAQIVST